MKVIKRLFVIIFFILILNLNSEVEAFEISTYQSDVNIDKSGTITIEDKMYFNITEHNVNNGMNRDFLTKYKNDSHNPYMVKYEFLSVKLDDKDEEYRTEEIEDGFQLYVGNENTFFELGEHTYEIKYQIKYPIYFDKEFDVIHYNITGYNKNFNVKNLDVNYYFPENTNIEDLKTDVYIGMRYTDAYKNYNINIDREKNMINIKVDKDQLFYKSDLRINMYLKKGIIDEPNFGDKLKIFLYHNKYMGYAFLGIIPLVLFCYITWYKYGNDPQKKVLIPIYESPNGLSPGEIVYIKSMGKYKKVFEASLVSLIAQKYLVVKEENNQSYIIKTDKDITNMKEDERIIYNGLEYNTKISNSLLLKYKLQTAKFQHEEYLKRKFEKRLYNKNLKMVLYAFIISLVMLIIYNFVAKKELANIFIIFCGFGVLTAIVYLIRLFIRIMFLSDEVGKGLIISIPLIIISFLINIGFIGMDNFIIITTYALIIKIYMFFIKTYTHEGVDIKNKIDGFRLFLETISEKNEETQEYNIELDRFYAYAYIFGIKESWMKEFDNMINVAKFKTFIGLKDK